MKKHIYWIILAVITVGYAVLTFWNLGNTFSPQTSINMLEGDSVVLNLGSPQDITRVNLFEGIAQGRYCVETEGGGPINTYWTYSIDASTDGTNWTSVAANIEHNAYEQFKWKTNNANTTAQYIRITCHSEEEGKNPSYIDPDYHEDQVSEVAIYGPNKTLLPIVSSVATLTTQNKDADGNLIQDPNADSTALYDEQKDAQYESNVFNSMYFDEVYHGRTGYEIVHGLGIFETTHPPLGKDLIALATLIMGMTPFAWRFFGALVGVLMIPALYLLTEKLLKNKTLALIASFLLAVDFMHFSLTRIATIDSYPVLFIIITFFFLAVYMERIKQEELSIWKRAMPLLWSGIFFGLACASKWIGLYIAPGILALLIYIWYMENKNSRNKLKTKELIKKHFWFCLLTFIVIPGIIYVSAYIPIMRYDLHGKGILQYVYDAGKSMYEYQAHLVATHPYSSVPIDWPFGQRPLYAYAQGADSAARGMVGEIWFNGTPIIWLLGSIAMLSLMIKTTKKSYWFAPIAFLFFAILAYAKHTSGIAVLFSLLAIVMAIIWIWNWDTKKKVPIFLSIAFMSVYLPWLLVPRISFIYHYFASVPILILAICYWLQYEHVKVVGKGKNREEKVLWKMPKWLWIVIPAIALVLFVAFYPMLSGVEISQSFSTHLHDIYKTLTLIHPAK